MTDLAKAAFFIQRELERLRAAGAPEESLVKLKGVLRDIRDVDVEWAESNDQACLQAFAGATFKPGFTLVLPSGKVLDGGDVELQRLSEEPYE